MSKPILEDNLYVILNSSNNFTSTGTLSVPIQNKTKCRVLSNHTATIQTNFTRDVFVLDSQSPLATKQPGICFAGDDGVWFDLKTNYIQTPTVTLISSPTIIDSLHLNFQFI